MASTGNNPTDPGPGAAKTETRSATETARREGEHLGERAREKADEFKQQAEQQAHGMRDRALSAVDHQKDAAVHRIEGVAHALRSASDDLRGRGQPMVAEYSRHLAEGLESMAGSLSQRNIDDLVGGVEDFARQRPVAFIGGAMVAGFALARFMKSSSARRSYAGRDEGGTAGSWPAQGTSTRPEYRGTSAGQPGPARPATGANPPPASAGTTPTESPSRSTEGGI